MNERKVKKTCVLEYQYVIFQHLRKSDKIYKWLKVIYK